MLYSLFFNFFHIIYHNLTVGAIAGIAAGSVLLILVVIVIFVIVIVKTMKKKNPVDDKAQQVNLYE